MNSREKFRGFFLSAAKNGDFPFESFVFQAPIARPAVGVNRAAGLNRIQDEGMQALRCSVRSVACGSGRCQVHPLEPRSPPGAFLLSACLFCLLPAHHERLIDLNPARQSVRSGRTIARRSLCSQVHAVSWLPSPRTRCKPSALAPCFRLIRYHMARNHISRGLRVS